MIKAEGTAVTKSLTALTLRKRDYVMESNRRAMENLKLRCDYGFFF